MSIKSGWRVYASYNKTRQEELYTQTLFPTEEQAVDFIGNELNRTLGRIGFEATRQHMVFLTRKCFYLSE